MTDRRPYIDAATIARFLGGECDANEAETIRRSIQADSELRQRVEAIRAVWIEAGGRPVEWDVDTMWTDLRAKMDPPTARRPPVRLVPAVAECTHPALRFQVPGSRSRWALIAASALVAIGAGSWWALGTRETVSRAAAGGAPPMREATTIAGQRAEFNLADGSRVVLAPESRLRIPADYNSIGGGRRLLLEGEAFFTVKHDSARPFSVQTADGIAEDVGTEFVVTAYPETGGTRVVVSTGVVALLGLRTDQPHLLTLKAGDLARIDTAGRVTQAHGVDLRPHLSWTEGTLIFDRTPLGDALPQIGRWFGLKIRLADPALGGRRLTATFRNESVVQVLEAIRLPLGLEVRQSGQFVTLARRSE